MRSYNVMHVLPDLAVGGGQVMVLRLLARLRERGRGVMVAAYGSEHTMAERFRQLGVPVCVLGLRGLRQMRGAVKHLEPIAKAQHISVLHTHGTAVDKILGHILSARLDIPEVTTIHGMPPTFVPVDKRLTSKVRKLMERGVFNLDWMLARSRLSAAVAVSEAVLEAWEPIMRKFFDDKKLDREVIHWGIDASEFYLRDEEAIRHVQAELIGASNCKGPIILAVSRLHESKNIRALPYMMKTVLIHWPDALLCIAGDGPEREALEKLIQDLNLTRNILWLGQRNDIPLLFQAANVAVFSSLVEGFGMVVLEALAAGTPVVCFNLPSLRALQEQVDAIHVATAYSPEALGIKISKVLADPSCYLQGLEARKIVLADWNLDRTTDAYDTLYTHLLSRGGAI